VQRMSLASDRLRSLVEAKTGSTFVPSETEKKRKAFDITS
jgi:hypothetical protein